MKNKKYIMYLVVSILVLTIGVCYAYFKARVSGEGKEYYEKEANTVVDETINKGDSNISNNKDNNVNENKVKQTNKPEVNKSTENNDSKKDEANSSSIN